MKKLVIFNYDYKYICLFCLLCSYIYLYISHYIILENKLLVSKLEQQLTDKQSIINEKTEVSFK